MRGGLNGLRSLAVQAVAAWLVSFGLLFQALLPSIGVPSTPGAQSLAAQSLAALCSSAHPDAGDQPNSPDDPHSKLCRSICALIHVGQFSIAPVVSYAVVVPRLRSHRIDVRADDPLVIVRAATAYSSRAPPAAA